MHGRCLYAAIAQLAERRTFNPGGSGFDSCKRHIRYFDRSDFRAVFILHEFREVVAVAYSKNKRIGRPPVFESKEELEKKSKSSSKAAKGAS